ncbi:MAG: lipopolysaccharide biosynthesis protein [Paludibacter sp.]|nr:lipopolysaccharide biosynthesis protein [Paludibacter sp.]
MFEDIKRISFRHKNNKPWYYLRNNLRRFYPSYIFQNQLDGKLNDLNGFDKEYIKQRVNYYNRLVEKVDLLVDAPSLSQFKLGEKQKTYFFDSFEYTRYYSSKLKARFLFGDITEVPSEPSIVKSRPIEGDVANSVVLNLDKIRHFLFVKDQKSFAEKKDMLVGRSKARQQHRLRFLDMYFNHPMCNIGQVNRDVNLQFLANRMTIGEHLDYKFILCLEGNDVASNLKWVMSSNSLAIMPKPKYETWFMEGTLIPDYHYVLIKDDYSDLEERMKYYIEHQDEALRIIENAHQYIRQFQNKRQEDVISLLVLKKYFEMTNQKI